MGNDGGDIPRRKQLVKDRKKVQLADPKAVAAARSRLCNLTKSPFSKPLAICRLGFIYNYEALLKGLVSKTLPKKYDYIRRKGDVKQIEAKLSSQSGENVIVCPISNIQYNGLNKFVVIWGCGHIYSVKAMKQIKEQNKCLICEEPYKVQDKISLNMTPQEQNVLKEQILARRKNKDKQLDAEDKIKQGQIQKKPKMEVPLNKLQQLDGNISQIIKGRDTFKEIFHKQYQQGDNLFIRPSKIGIR